MNAETIGAALKRARKEAGLSQRELAKNGGGYVSGAAICRIESGQRMPARHGMAAYALALGVTFGINAEGGVALVHLYGPDGQKINEWEIEHA